MSQSDPSVTCLVCGGTGIVRRQTQTTCPSCNGWGGVQGINYSGDYTAHAASGPDCQTCNNTHTVTVWADEPCSRCGSRKQSDSAPSE